MNEGLLEIPTSGIGPQEDEMEIDGDVNKPSVDALPVERTAIRGNGVERISEVVSPLEALAPSDSPVNTQDEATPVKYGCGETKMDPGGATEEPPMDWFEPLEDDDDDDDDDENDAHSWDFSVGERRINGRREAEEESLAGESEKSGSVAGSEKNFKKRANNHFSLSRRKKTKPEEGWEEWPVLGEGWMRKAVVRRSGSSVGQKDVYYMSPSGERVRSRVELSKNLGGTLDMSMFEYKSGVFVDGQHKPLRGRRKKVIREHSPSVDGGFSSESSWIDKGDRADSPDSHHRITPGQILKPNHRSLSPLSPSSMGKPGSDPYLLPATASPTPVAHSHHDADGLRHNATKLPWSPTSRPPFSINGKASSETCICICSECGISYTGSESERQRKKSCCPKCRAKSPVDNRKITFRKWLPCGQCMACLTTEDCGMCASCRNGMLNPDSRKPVRCRKRKCLCPIRKHKPDVPQVFEPMMNFQNERVESQNSSHQNSDTEDFSMCVDGEDEDDDFDLDFDGDDDEYEAWAKKRKRRSCGKCDACLCRKDCGTCDFCIDKPKFGGSNKKRQKCRLRQCRRQAMLGQTEFGTQEGRMQDGRQKPQYTYSRKTTPRKSKAVPIDMEFTDDEEEEEEDERSMGTGLWGSQQTSSSKPYHEMHFGNHQPRVQATRESVEPFQRNGLPESIPNTSNHSISPAQSDTVFRKADSVVRLTDCRLSGGDGARLVVDQEADMHSRKPEVEEEVTPMITQIFSLADSTASTTGIDQDQGLMQLLENLRTSALPILWFAIMVEGPRLQLVQCSKLSAMTDTILHIDPGFYYQITVQGQPLLLTHPLYELHPPRLNCVTHVVTLLLDLERYRVCQGVPIKEPPIIQAPLICERASTCDFLVRKHVECCDKCNALTCE